MEHHLLSQPGTHYLDNSATTSVLPQGIQLAAALMGQQFGNPSSLHTMGFQAKQAVEEARAQVAQVLGCESREIVFTSGGTEANNLALLGAARARKRRGNRIVTTAVEHDSVLQPLAALEQEGFQVIRVPPQSDGTLSPAALEDAIDQHTILVSVMAVNNETGALFPIEKIAGMVQRKKAPALIHSDCVQAFCKLPLRPKSWGLDLVTVSGHKLHAPKGVGALMVSRTARLLPCQLGGGQEGGMRSGTENVPGIGAFGLAAQLAPKPGTVLPQIQALWDQLAKGLVALPGVQLLSPQGASPYVLSFSCGQVRSETMLHFLAERGVYVSAGSACGKSKPSHVLEAMALPRSQIQSALRASFSRFSTAEDVEALILGVREGVLEIRVGG